MTEILHIHFKVNSYVQMHETILLKSSIFSKNSVNLLYVIMYSYHYKYKGIEPFYLFGNLTLYYCLRCYWERIRTVNGSLKDFHVITCRTKIVVVTFESI